MKESCIASISRQILSLIKHYPELPETLKKDGAIQLSETDSRTTSMSITIESIGNENKTYVCGTKRLVFLVTIYYQVIAQTDDEKLKVIDFLSKLGSWMCAYETKTNNSSKKAVESSGVDLIAIRICKDANLIKKGINGLYLFSLSMKSVCLSET